ncbi:MAG TPA: hypothetical protein VHD62_11705 [Opitutaceae bacterium]|nr:hypothetical protein [Opitutaceae bacterium]
MPTRAHSIFLAAVGLMAGTTARAQLAANSPFAPAASSVVAAPTANAPLEFEGFAQDFGAPMLFRIFDPAKKTGVFLPLNERNAELDVLVKQYDPEHKTVTVEHGGRTLTIEERKAKIASSGAMPMMPPMVQMAPGNVAPVTMAPAGGQPTAANPSQAEERARLEQVAQEVARRRALREQTATPGAQPAGAQPQAPAQAQANSMGIPASAVRRGPAPAQQPR